jgi:AcrR family transcriptional regulator
MTSSIGYENVTTRDIAQKVGISVASIYNHFKTKASMLEYAYKYHAEHQFNNRKSNDYMKKLIEYASAEEVIFAFMYSQESEDRRQFVRMALITKIIYMRIFQDPLAKAAFLDTSSSNTEFIYDVVSHGVQIGRVVPDFDILTFAEVFIGAMQNMGVKAFIDVNYTVRNLDQQATILKMLSRLLASAFIN